jgi:hypothetical protein
MAFGGHWLRISASISVFFVMAGLWSELGHDAIRATFVFII